MRKDFKFHPSWTEKDCLNCHQYKLVKAQKILKARTWTPEKQPHFSPKKKKRNPQSKSCHSRRNMCHGNSRGKMCYGKILTDSAQDKNVQIDAKLNAIEQANTYPSNEENSQHPHKKRWRLNPGAVWRCLSRSQQLCFGRIMKVSPKKDQEGAAEMNQGATEVQGSVTELHRRCVTQPSYITTKQVLSNNTVHLLLESHFWDTVLVCFFFSSWPALLAEWFSRVAGFQLQSSFIFVPLETKL